MVSVSTLSAAENASTPSLLTLVDRLEVQMESGGQSPTPIPSSSPSKQTSPTLHRVHPVSARRNFRYCSEDTPRLNWSNKARMMATRNVLPDGFYARMRPALCLASGMLEQARPFLAKITFAKQTCPPSSSAKLPTKSLLDKTYVASTKDLEQLDGLLLGLAQSLRIFRSSSKAADRVAWARCRPLLDIFTGNMSAVAGTEKPPLALILSAKLFDFFTRPYAYWADSSEHTIRLMQWRMAVALCHEISHAIWLLRRMRINDLLVDSPIPQLSISACRVRPQLKACWNDRWNWDQWFSLPFGTKTGKLPDHESNLLQFEEPFIHYDDPDAELGRALEHQLFGGITWGPYWNIGVVTRPNQKVEKVRYESGSPTCFISRWIWTDGIEDMVKSMGKAKAREKTAAGKDVACGEAVASMDWSEFAREESDKLIPLSEEVLAGIFSGTFQLW